MILNELIKQMSSVYFPRHEIINQLKQYSSFEEVCKDDNAPYWFYYYAQNVVEGRWEEGEPTILLSPEWSFYYARDIIQGRWEECEPTILMSIPFSYYYCLYILKQRWSEAEHSILLSKSSQWCCNYALDIIQGRWLEAEPIIFDNDFYKEYYQHYFNIIE